MKKIFIIMTLALCCLISNAQDFNNNYNYSFWSNWSIGAGAVYSKPMDLTTWSFDDGANIGVDVRLQKQLTKFWTLRMDACVPQLLNIPAHDRYGTATIGMNFNIGDSFYLFGDGGIGVKRFNLAEYNDNIWLTCDAGLGARTRFTKRSSMYLEIGTDCSSYFALDNMSAFAKIGYMYSFGITNRDYEALNQPNGDSHEGYVTVEEYNTLKEENDLMKKALDEAITDVNRMKECCENNSSSSNKEIERLNKALNDIRANAVTTYGVPFSVLFKKNSVELDATAKEIVKNVAVEMKRDENATYTLYGFGDYSGSDDYNQVISEARCESVKKELVKCGVSEDRIQTVGFGKSKYFGNSESYLNRRVTFVKNF